MARWVSSFCLLLWSTVALGQFSLDPSIGYFMQGDVWYKQGKLRVRDNVVYNLDMTYMVTDGIGFQLGYSISPSTAAFRSYEPLETPSRDLRINTHQIIGSTVLGYPFDKVLLHITPGLGLTISDPEKADELVLNQWYFTGSLALGARYQFSRYVGAFARGRLLLPFSFYNYGAYCGYGLGLGTLFPACGLGYYGDFFSPQGDFSAGFIFRLTED